MTRARPASSDDDFLLPIVVTHCGQSLAPINGYRLRKRFGETLAQCFKVAFLTIYSRNFLNPATTLHHDVL